MPPKLESWSRRLLSTILMTGCLIALSSTVRIDAQSTPCSSRSRHRSSREDVWMRTALLFRERG